MSEEHKCTVESACERGRNYVNQLEKLPEVSGVLSVDISDEENYLSYIVGVVDELRLRGYGVDSFKRDENNSRIYSIEINKNREVSSNA